MREAFEQRRKLIVSILSRIPGLRFTTPKGAFYVLVDIAELLGKHFRGECIDSDLRFSELLMEHSLVSVVPGSPFYAPGCLRLSYAIDNEKLQEAGRRISDFVSEFV
jgi:aspartate/methionine/tyrosine aminotransferase